MLVFNVQISQNLLEFRLRVKNLVFQDQNLSKFGVFTSKFINILRFYVKILVFQDEKLSKYWCLTSKFRLTGQNLLKFKFWVKNLVFQDQNLSKFWVLRRNLSKFGVFTSKFYQHSEVLRQNLGFSR